MEDIHVVSVINDSFAKHLAVMLTSLLENKKSKHPIHIYVIAAVLSEQNKMKLNRTLKKYKQRLNYLSIDNMLYKDCKVDGHISEECYFRLSIPDLLDTNISKALYLDSDMIVKEDITELWQYDINNYYLAAVKDPAGSFRIKDLSIPSNSNYFNSGVLLMNLTKWKKDKVREQVISFIKDNPKKIRWWDQDGLNAILHDKWYKLDKKWNYQASYFHEGVNPAILHYTSSNKPWNGNPPGKSEYLYYLNKILWD